ncbi:DNA-methyltransferase [Umezakia ovalisporum]|jgi:site-specific DNA-methyltransferase (adenine-specific)|uniref:Methyltransferase n=1 Tax=Umezakia ovalisporum FSS-43 TaxID=2740520 RepID=A0ABT6K593_9CYAN|nr:site-specific DNA-methyltransferase [Umezakia ovalisporum]MBI1240293.1 site-specific DNA-methyltransferase [Nostoc sp. RI_552]MDH6057250.1 site-specific DNA-methyltransferase [Umezakia ovalisporum FSS-43]MDH6068794.1 site-specific DNA-methyltransferase [Umezakia ovalisporum APH033B]MDH6070283.1 site-specific DNA-methyltransferase [Umezakia ovalisporum CobakiLakeA]MDH6076037.1 site-specific DNA-methyltransferase [Umezakia ovalisporum CS-1034]
MVEHSSNIGVVEQHASQKELQPLTKGFQLQYTHPHGKLYQGNSIDWLASLESETVDLVFADPPYNIKKAAWDNFENQEEYIDWSIQWISEASRILKSTGSLYVCGFSEILADLKYPASKYFNSCRWLIWHYKNKANLGHDWGRSHESIIHFRKSDFVKINIDDVRIPYGAHTLKYPSHPQAETSAYGKGTTKKHNSWTPHPKGAKPKDVIEIPTTCNGMGEKTPHPTQKPEELIRKFVLASSEKGNLIVDPFSGSGTTIVVAEQLNRYWMGCDLSVEYNYWATKRLENVLPMTKEQWIAFDRKNAERRDSIR